MVLERSPPGQAVVRVRRTWLSRREYRADQLYYKFPAKIRILWNT